MSEISLESVLSAVKAAIAGSALIVTLPREAMVATTGLDINCGSARINDGVVEVSLDWGNCFVDSRGICEVDTANLMSELAPAIEAGLLRVRLDDSGLPEGVCENVMPEGYSLRRDKRWLLLNKAFRKGFAIHAIGKLCK